MAPTDRHETYIALGGQMNEDLHLPAETLSIELTCTNGSLPRERLKEGMITQPSAAVPAVTDLTNLTQPTLDVSPPTREHPEFLWQFVSHLSFNRMSVASAEAMRGVLSLYDWSGSDANRRKLAGLKNVTWKPREMLRRGAIVRGAEVVLEIEEDHFEDEGDIGLFGLVLSEFFGLYATINSFVDVTIVLAPSGRRYEWKSKKGQLPPV
jgi:type VI secretion system protein ImpG